MSCSSTEELFEPFLEARLAGAQRIAFVRHIDDCADCRGLLEEFRVVDALLTRPRTIELAPNFTFVTLAEVRAMPPPAPYRPPLQAYLAAYLAAAWLLAGAMLLFAPATMHALAGTLVDIARSLTDALGGVGAAIARVLGRGGNILTAVLAALLVLDAALVAGLGLVLKVVRPRLLERLRP